MYYTDVEIVRPSLPSHVIEPGKPQAWTLPPSDRACGRCLEFAMDEREPVEDSEFVYRLIPPPFTMRFGDANTTCGLPT